MKTVSTSRIYLFCAALFALTGSLFIVISVFFVRNFGKLEAHTRGDIRMVPAIFALLGIVQVLVACALFRSLYRKAALRRELLQNGDYVMADFTGFPADYSVRVNRRPTYRVECCYQDPQTGTLHVFQGERFLFNPSPYVSQQKIRVYVDRESDYTKYFVDTDSLGIEVKRHG